MQGSARKVLDTADIVRDGDLSPIETMAQPVGLSDYFWLAYNQPNIGLWER